MPYTLTGAPALGFDLARLPGGAQVAAALRTCLGARGEDLARLAEQHPGESSRSRWAEALAALPAHEQVRATVPHAGEAVSRAARGDTVLLRRLEVSLLGDAGALDRFVRAELLDWTWIGAGPVRVQDPVAALAADVVVDAALAGFHAPRLDPAVRRAMAAPLLRAGVPLRDRQSGCGLVVLDDALDELAGATPAVRDRWRRVVDLLRDRTASWAPAMHRATWALATTERLRLAADAQLRAVAAFHDAGFEARDAAYGTWNALAGVVHGLAAVDLLDDATAEILLRPWTLVHGGPGPR